MACSNKLYTTVLPACIRCPLDAKKPTQIWLTVYYYTPYYLFLAPLNPQEVPDLMAQVTRH